jgi:hypothetical protein
VQKSELFAAKVVFSLVILSNKIEINKFALLRAKYLGII